MIILQGRAELLVTGGILGCSKNDNMNFFLGANLKFKKHIDSSSEQYVYILQESLPDTRIIKEERLLQNYSRRGANYKWALRSFRFCEKGFRTTNPLYVCTTNLETAASVILKCLAYNTFTTEDQDILLNIIHEASATYSLNAPRIANDLTYLELLKQNCYAKFTIVINATIQLINVLSLSYSPQSSINGTLATSLYSDAVGYRCTMLNDSRVSNESFLM